MPLAIELAAGEASTSGNQENTDWHCRNGCHESLTTREVGGD
jgi:hypothetical protein